MKLKIYTKRSQNRLAEMQTIFSNNSDEIKVQRIQLVTEIRSLYFLFKTHNKEF